MKPVVKKELKVVKREPRREKRPPMPVRSCTPVATQDRMKSVDSHLRFVCR